MNELLVALPIVAGWVVWALLRWFAQRVYEEWTDEEGPDWE